MTDQLPPVWGEDEILNRHKKAIDQLAATRPWVRDDDAGTIKITFQGAVVKICAYETDAQQGVAMRLARAWQEGFIAGRSDR